MDGPLDVSLLKLIASPEPYRGKAVRVIGYLMLQFEGNALYLHEEDALYAISANALAVDCTPAMRLRPDGYVRLEAVFDPDATGHRGVFSSGGLVQVRRCEDWPPDALRQAGTPGA